MSKVNQTEDPSLMPSDLPKYKTYPYRFYIIFLFEYGVFICSMMWLSFSPLQTQLKEIYKISLFEVTLGTNLIVNLLYAPASVLCNYLINKIGFRKSLIIASILVASGLWIRTICRQGFGWIIAGQAVAAFGLPFFMATGQKFSALWFPPNERTAATTLIYGLLPFGNAVGALLPAIMVDPDARDSDAFDQIEDMLTLMAYTGTGLVFSIFFTFKDKPDLPPSPSARAKKYDLKTSIKLLAKNSNFLLALIACSVYKGVGDGLSAVSEPIELPLGITELQSSIILAICILFSIGGSFLATFLFQRIKKLKKIIVGYMTCGTILCFLTAFVGSNLGYKGFMYFVASSFLFITGISPLQYELLGELSFPCTESLPGTLYLFGVTYTGVVIGLILDKIVETQGTYQSKFAIFVSGAIILIPNICMFFVKEDLKRTKFENEEETKPLMDESQGRLSQEHAKTEAA